MKVFKPLIFYVQWPGVDKEDLIMEVNQLGRLVTNLNGLKYFTRYHGWFILEKCIDLNREDIINNTNIIDSNGIAYNLDQFMNRIKDAEIK